MKKAKKIIITSVILTGIVFLFIPEVSPNNYQIEEILKDAANADVVIVFNSGGWGNTPLERAEDFQSIISGIQTTLNEWGYKSIVIPYNRTKESFLGRLTGARDFLTSFNNSAEDFSEKIDLIVEKLPDKKIIITGLSNGGTLINKAYDNISQKVQDSIYAVSVGTPFWSKKSQSDNILQVNNGGKDVLSEGNIGSLLLAFIKTPFSWVFSKIKSQNLKFSEAFHAPGHNYSWDSPEVGPEIVTFLEKKFVNYEKN